MGTGLLGLHLQRRPVFYCCPYLFIEKIEYLYSCMGPGWFVGLRKQKAERHVLHRYNSSHGRNQDAICVHIQIKISGGDSVKVWRLQKRNSIH